MLGSAGLVSAAGVGAYVYRTAPSFWNQFTKELGRPVLPPVNRSRPQVWADQGIHAAWLGHTTVLLKVDGTTILTDPVFSTRVGLNLGPVTLGLKRLVAPALTLSELPKIDLILLSHAHMDHLDVPSLRALESTHAAVITAAETSDLLRPKRYGSVKELRWGERARIGSVEVRALEVNHWGARMRTDTYRGYNGYLLEAGRYRILFGGDTAITPAFRQIRTSRPVDLAIMPVGAYNPWIYVHCTPEEAWRMAGDAGAEFFLPVHHHTFQLSREPVNEPIERLRRAAGAHQDRIALERIGDEFAIA